MQIIDTQHDIGKLVFLVTDPEQYPHLVTGYLVRKDGIRYALSMKGQETYHYDFEIISEKDIIKALSE